MDSGVMSDDLADHLRCGGCEYEKRRIRIDDRAQEARAGDRFENERY
jgi:hypothetical protein